MLLYQVTLGALWILIPVAGVAVGRTFVLQRRLLRSERSLSQWTTAVERQAAEMKDWHKDLVGRETALRGPGRDT